MAAILINPYPRLKITSANRNVYQALAVDLCAKAKIKYTADLRQDFNRATKIKFATPQALIKRLIVNYTPFENKFQVSSIVKRKISANQLIIKVRGLDNNTVILGFNANQKPSYFTSINGRLAVFSNDDPKTEITNYVIIKPIVNPINKWIINLTNTDSIETHELSMDNNKLICNKHGYNKCIAYDLVIHNKLEPGPYTFLTNSNVDDLAGIDLNTVPLKSGFIADNSLNDTNYKYKEYADTKDQLNFMLYLIDDIIYDTKDKADCRKLLNQAKTTNHAMARNNLIAQVADILNNYTESQFIVMKDIDEILSEVQYNDPPTYMSQKELNMYIDYGLPFKKLKCSKKDILTAVINQKWDDVIDLLCENHGGTKKVNQQLQKLLANSSIYMAVPGRILADNLGKEILSCYITGSKPGIYVERRLDVDVNKHKASLNNLLSFPKYGILSTKDYPFSSSVLLTEYGSVLIEFKEVIKERSTLCVGDSLDNTISSTASFKDLSIHNFLSVLLQTTRTHYSMVLDNNNINKFVNLLNNIMNSTALKYGLDINYLMRGNEEFLLSYFEVQIKGDLLFNERDIKAIYVNTKDNANIIINAMHNNNLDIPLKYSQPIPKEYLNTLATLDIRQGNKHFTDMVI